MRSLFKRLLGAGKTEPMTRPPVLMENVKAAPPPDASLERQADKLRRELAHGYMVMNQRTADIRAELGAAALRQLDRR